MKAEQNSPGRLLGGTPMPKSTLSELLLLVEGASALLYEESLVITANSEDHIQGLMGCVNEMRGTVRDMQEDEFWHGETALVSGNSDCADEFEESAEASSLRSGRLKEVGGKDVSTCASRAAGNEVASFKASCEAWALHEELEGRQPRRDKRQRAFAREKSRLQLESHRCASLRSW